MKEVGGRERPNSGPPPPHFLSHPGEHHGFKERLLFRPHPLVKIRNVVQTGEWLSACLAGEGAGDRPLR